MSTFDGVSRQYQKQALVQQAAAEKLLGLLKIGMQEDVLDVGCGPGHITHRLKTLASGRVVGTAFYDVPLDDDYIRRFNEYVRMAIEHRAKNGKVVIDFRRLYYAGNRRRGGARCGVIGEEDANGSHDEEC